MKNLILISVVTSALLFSCSGDSTDANNVNAVAEFEIEGMVCEMGCGASLRKGLYETGYVSEVKVDYAEENPSNSIKVYFDKENLSTDKMEEIIESLNEKQFEANFVSLEELSASDREKFKKQKSSTASKSPKVEASTSSISFPNITKLLNSLIY